MSRLVVGVIGHVDHGKTALVRALTGTETDRLPEEKRRGISIALGFAQLAAGPGEVVDLIDMPGHERFVRTMIAGATGIDAVLLVVAATEGVKPQTVEHVEIAALLGLRRAVVAVSKADLVASDTAAAVGADAAALLRRAGLDAGPALSVSAVRGEGIAALAAALAGLPARDRTAGGAPFLPIDRAFTVAGHGTVVTGTLRGGPIAAGDVLALLPRGREARVRGVQVHGGRVAAAAPGQRVAVNLRDIAVAELERGDALAPSGLLAPSAWLTVALRAVAGAPPLRNGTRLQALFGTVELEARLRLLDRDVLEPGEAGLAQLHLASAASVPARESVVLRLASPAQTVAGGAVIEPETRRRRRHDSATLNRLAALAAAAPADLVGAEISRAGARGVALSSLSRLSALGPALVIERAEAAGAIVAGRHVAVTQAAFETVVAQVRQVLAGTPTISRNALATALPHATPAVRDAAVAALIRAGAAHESSGALRAVQPDRDRERARADAALATQLEAALRAGGLSPPDPATLATTVDRRRALDRLVRAGILVRAPDQVQKRVVLFHVEAVRAAERALRPLLAQPPGLTVGEAGTALGVSRKFSVPLLEYLDSIRFTRRVQDRRILAVPQAAR